MFEEDLYWANQVNFEEDTPINKILTANKFLANNSRPTEIVSKLDDVTSELHIFHAALQIESKKVFQSLLTVGCVMNIGYTAR